MAVKLAWSTVLTLRTELVTELVINAVSDNVPVLSWSDTLRVSTARGACEYCAGTTRAVMVWEGDGVSESWVTASFVWSGLTCI